MSSCGGKGSSSSPSGTAAPTVSTFTVSAATITSGSSTTLSWTVSNASSVSIDHGVGTVTGSSVSVSPTATTIYTLTATNSAGSTSATITVTVNAALVAPSGLAYSTNPAVYTVGVAITPNTPSSSGGAISSYSVSPTLPAGLSLNTATGIISGTPTAASVSAAYTVTASNSAGSTTATVSIVVNAVLAAPSGLAYSTNPAVYTVGVAITPNTPSSNGGIVSSYGVSPTLPAGLSLNTTTGIISGTPTATSASTAYTVTANNAAGSATATVTITISAALTAPSGLTYSANPAVYTVGAAITPNTPNSSGGTVSSYSISPALPAGLSLNTTTGSISGTPTATAATTAYTVMANNAAGSTTAAVRLTVNTVETAPNGLTYSANSAIYAIENSIPSNAPNTSGGAVASYNVSPTLPDGLSLNTTTGVISGTPTTTANGTAYTITATNTAGSTTSAVAITVNTYVTAPSGLAYSTSPVFYTEGTAITPNTPNSNGGAVTSYSVSPALPDGLSLNTTTGVISGTPTTAMDTATYTITASNSAGNTTAAVSITVNTHETAPNWLAYSTNPMAYTVGTVITPNRPSSSGGAVTSYSVSPALPTGLSLNTSVGVISGKPTSAVGDADYTITATNAAGSTTATVTITVNAAVVAPSGLRYSTNPAVYTVGTAITSNTPSFSGGAVSAYKVSPSLPAGLNLNSTTGVISGVPTIASTSTVYTVTATNSAGSTTASITITVNAPLVPPVITNLSPSQASSAGSAYTLTVNGRNFIANSVVWWNNVSLNTTYISSTQLTAQVPASLIASVGHATIDVASSADVVSSSVSYPIVLGAPVIDSMTPRSITWYSWDCGYIDVLINGKNFTSISTVQFGNHTAPVNFVNSGQVFARLYKLYTPGDGSMLVTVKNASGTSSGMTFWYFTMN